MNWYFRDSNGVQGPITESQLRAILSREIERTAGVRSESSNWVPADVAIAKFLQLDQAGVYLRSNNSIYGPFVDSKAEQLQRSNPGKFDASRRGVNGTWTALTPPPITAQVSHLANLSVPPLVPPSVPRAVSTKARKSIRWIKMGGFCVWSIGMVILGASISQVDPSQTQLDSGLLGKSSRPLTKAEFKQRFKSIGMGTEKLKSLYGQYGEPNQTQNIGKKSYWYWDCSDGKIQMVIHNPLSSRGPVFGQEGSEYVTILEINDY